MTDIASISEKLDLDNGCSTATVEAKIKEALNQLATYNKTKAKAAAEGNEFERIEKELARLSKQILLGAAMKFDHDSDEYEMVGGVRMSDRKRSRPKAATPEMA